MKILQISYQDQDLLSAIGATSENREEEYYEENVFVFIVSCFRAWFCLCVSGARHRR
jgi:hypothetical protein